MPRCRKDGTPYPSTVRSQTCSVCNLPGSANDRVRTCNGVKAHTACRAEKLTGARIMARVVKADSGCWEWQGAKHNGGYGQLRVNNIACYTHRLSYEWHVGPIPEGMELDHLCRNRICCNPDHLEPVTSAENTRRGEPANRTHCASGHGYTPENTYYYPGTRLRTCRKCHAEQESARKSAKRKALREAEAAGLAALAAQIKEEVS